MSDKTDKVAEAVAYVRAETAAGRVQYEHRILEWVTTRTVILDGNYRAKPEPTVRPWRFEEVPIGAEVRHKETGTRSEIETAKPDGSVIVANHFGTYHVNTIGQFFVLANGDPCGIVEGE